MFPGSLTTNHAVTREQHVDVEADDEDLVAFSADDYEDGGKFSAALGASKLDSGGAAAAEFPETANSLTCIKNQ